MASVLRRAVTSCSLTVRLSALSSSCTPFESVSFCNGILDFRLCFGALFELMAFDSLDAFDAAAAAFNVFLSSTFFFSESFNLATLDVVGGGDDELFRSSC